MTAKQTLETKYLCIGGHFDGEWHSSRHPQELIMPDFPSFKDFDLSLDMCASVQEATMPTVRQHRYIKTKFHFQNENPQSFWLFEEWTSGLAFSKLLENYKRNPKK